MKNKILYVAVGLVLLVGVGLGAYWKINSTPKVANEIKNIEVMKNDSSTKIVIDAELEYFPGVKGYLVTPEAPGTYPGVVMIHENRGLRPEIKSAAEELAKEGYMVLAVNLLGGVAEDQEGARALTSQFDQNQGVENMKAAVKYLRENGANKVASLGWCFGGRQSVALAISGEDLDATVVYYGSNLVSTADELKPIKWPVLGIFGAEDQAIPLSKVEEFEQSLKTLAIKNEIYIYPGVGHAFANPSGANYAPEETKDAWAKTLNFLSASLQK